MLSSTNLERSVATVFTNSGIFGVTPSDLANRILTEAARLLKYKKSERDQLSSTTFTLAAYFYSRSLDRAELSTEERELADTFAGAGLSSGILDEIAGNFFDRIPDVPGEDSDYPSEADLEKVRLGQGMAAVMEAWSSRETLQADVLLRVLLDTSKTGIFQRVAKLRNAQPSRSSEPPPTGEAASAEEVPQGSTDNARARPKSAPGRHVKVVREATPNELGLNILDYAKALATILRASEGEFSFALFGKWGSGKTTLLRLLKPLLEDPVEYRKEVSVPKEEGYADLEYKVALHNAWKYRSPPECWIYLYKNLAAGATKSMGWAARWALALRSRAERHGYGSLCWPLVLFAIALVPMQAKLHVVLATVSVLGFSAALYLALISPNSAKKIRELFDKNLRLVGPDENLGMLALIGDDVRALIKACTKAPSTDKKTFPLLPVAGLAAASLLWAFVLYLGPVFEIPMWLRAAISKVWSLDEGPSAVGIAHWTVWLLWTLLSQALILVPELMKSSLPDRILLVIDDLDRCDALEMLSVIENVRLLLDDEEINARMQVLMLVDESVLNHAIAHRYDTMISDRASSADYRESDKPREAASAEIIAEQVEKLFACHLRLSRLSDSDVVQLVQKLAGHENEQNRRKLEIKEQEENEKVRVEAKMKLDEADRAAESASARYRSVVEGEPAPLKDPDGPSRHQPSWQARVRTGIDFFPKTGSEKEQVERENQRIKDWNRDIAGLSPQQRLNQDPGVADSLEKARKEAAELRALYEKLPRRPDPVEPRASDAPFIADDVRFSDDEIELLSSFMPAYFRALHRRPSPRSIKALLFKLQLARLLMQLRYPNSNGEELHIEKLLEFLHKEALGAETESSPHALIVRQVL